MFTERSELLGILPTVRNQPQLHDLSTGLSYVTEPDDTFVVPVLQRADEGSPAPSLILVEARAAVGKSMLARHLAWGTRAPLWDLSQVYVGSGTLWGSLARAFGPLQLNSIIGQTLTGDFALIIDALDEAELHAIGEAFDAFLAELRDMFSTPRPAPGVVILGRTETIDYLELFLGSQVMIRRYRILDFDRELAYHFVDNRLDFGKISEPSFTPRAHRRRESLYCEAQQRLFDFLADRLLPDRTRLGNEAGTGEDWPARLRSFLGYAPVLEAIAEYLASYAANYQLLIAELGNMESDPYNSGNAQWNLLRTIVWRLLKREQGKVAAQLSKIVEEPGRIDWEEVYTPDEQCGYVLGRITGSQELLDAPSAIPSEFLPRYREVLKNAAPNHPFLGDMSGYANVVFRDYVHAWGLQSANDAAGAAVRSELHADDYLPSPLLGPFIITSTGDQGTPTEPFSS